MTVQVSVTVWTILCFLALMLAAAFLSYLKDTVRDGIDMETKLNSRYDLWTAPKSLIEVAPEDYLDFYNNGYNPVEQIPSAEGGMVVGWGLGRCYDCVLAGGTLEKPSFE